MHRLTEDQYDRFVQTERVTLTAASSNEKSKIHKGFLALHSSYFAKVIDKPSASNEEGQAEFKIDCAATAIKIFARWCYKGQLKAIDITNARPETLNRRKILLIDLWIFGETYGIAALQNEAIEHLAQVLTAYPHILTKEDVQYTFMRSTNEASPLRHLVTMITVVMLEVGAKTARPGNLEEGIRGYEIYAQSFPGFMTLIYKWQRAWLILAGAEKGKRDDASKLPGFVANKKVYPQLLVKKPEVEGWVLGLLGVEEKKSKKEKVAGVEGDREVIVIDDD